MRGSRGDPASANASDDSDGCDVMPPMMLTAPSTTSTPASIAARYELMALPAVSCMCRCSGTSTASLSALTSIVAARGLSRPAMSLIASRCVPRRQISLAMST